MLIMNPTKPFYIDKKNKVIRMGNFKYIGKEIEYEDEVFIKLFDYLKKPIKKKELIDSLEKNTSYDREDIDNTINYLIEEKFIINKEEYDELIDDKIYNREKLYFYMLNDNKVMFDNIKNKKILILGVGAIGSISINLLARSGFNNFIIVDNDYVEESNLIRQLTYDKNDIGKLKVNIIKEKMYNINSNINIKIKNKLILEDIDIEKEIESSDFVLCTIDKPIRVIRRLINDLCIKHNKPVLFSGFAESTAIIGPFVVPYKSACLSCIENITNDEIYNNVEIVPSYGPLCNLISSITVDEIINYFLNFKKTNLIGKSLMFNMYNYETEIINWEKNKNCKKCGDKNDSNEFMQKL